MTSKNKNNGKDISATKFHAVLQNKSPRGDFAALRTRRDMSQTPHTSRKREYEYTLTQTSQCFLCILFSLSVHFAKSIVIGYALKASKRVQTVNAFEPFAIQGNEKRENSYTCNSSGRSSQQEPNPGLEHWRTDAYIGNKKTGQKNTASQLSKPSSQ